LTVLLIGFAFDVTKDNRCPVFIRQAVQFLIENRLQIPPNLLTGRFGVGHLHHLPFAEPSTGGVGLCFQGHMIGNRVEPVSHRTAPVQGTSPTKEHEKGGLEGVLGRMTVVQDTPADAQHHRAVSPDQGGKRGLLVPAEELLQQLSVR
jgi:hypothetical protein